MSRVGLLKHRENKCPYKHDELKIEEPVTVCYNVGGNISSTKHKTCGFAWAHTRKCIMYFIPALIIFFRLGILCLRTERQKYPQEKHMGQTYFKCHTCRSLWHTRLFSCAVQCGCSGIFMSDTTRKSFLSIGLSLVVYHEHVRTFRSCRIPGAARRVEYQA